MYEVLFINYCVDSFENSQKIGQFIFKVAFNTGFFPNRETC